MGKKKQNDEAKKEKPLYGSGAEPSPEPKDDGLVKCICTVPCAWRGYHDEGDRVFVERNMLESAFFKAHFKPLEPLVCREMAGAGGETVVGGNGTDAGSNGTAAGDNADGENGQGELGLK